MLHYKIVSKDDEVRYISIPSLRFLKIALCLVFRSNSLKLPFEYDDIDDLIDEKKMYGEEAKKELSKIISWERITKKAHISASPDYDYQDREEYFNGKLPSDWYEVANDHLINNGLIDQLTWNSDLEEYINGNIYTYWRIEYFMRPNLGISDPIKYLENWSRYLYGIVINRGKIS